MEYMLQLNNIRAKIANHRNQIDRAITRVIDSGWVILGSEVQEFERKFAAFLQASYCIGVANGTDAIELALRAMDIAPGDFVATVANAGMYTTTALLAIGAQPYFMDVDLETKCASLVEVKRAIDAGVKAVVITHLYGYATPEIALIVEYCNAKGVRLLEDCAQAHGARINKQCVGTFGDAASFSFYPTKNLGALGDGGAIVTNNEEIAEKIRLLRTYGWSDKYNVVLNGARNSRLDEIQAAVLSELLTSLDAMNTKRREIANRYSESIIHPHIEVPRSEGECYVAHLYVIRTSRRGKLMSYLKQHKIASDIHFPIPDYKQPIFKNAFSGTHLTATEILAGEVLTLPCYPELSDDEVNFIITVINDWPL